MNRYLEELLNQFGLCISCFKPKAYRNMFFYCDECGYDKNELTCVDPDIIVNDVDGVNEAYRQMCQVVKELANHYQSDPEFWKILLQR